MSLSLLPTRDLTPDERSAHDELPRPGVWAGEGGADLRALTQDETDGLIRRMLYAAAAPGEHDELVAAVGMPRGILVLAPPPGRKAAHSQRGGIDSDPLVRLLAYRAWGDRDQRWFELRGVRKGEAITTIHIGDGCLRAALPWVGEIGVALAGRDARPGERVDFVVPNAGSSWFVVSDRLRAEPELSPRG
jgi:hypothetical protein